MGQATYHFPRGFLWGTATAAHQVEGNNVNSTWWAWDQQEGHILRGQKSGLASDWWGGRWREDLDRAAESGQNAHRLSVEWSRIQPAPDRWDEDALDRYREMLRGLKERNLTPLVTLHHFSEPVWFAEQGGWENEEAPGAFEKYTRKVVEALKEYATYWITINEPNNIIALHYLRGTRPPGKQSFGTAMQVARILIRSHAAAYRVIHSLQPQARVGATIFQLGFLPSKSWFPPDSWAASMQFHMYNNLFPFAMTRGATPLPVRMSIPEAKNTLDFLGVSYYTRYHVAFSLAKPAELFGRQFYPPGTDLSSSGFYANDPEGMFEALKWGRQFKVPMIVTENGIDDAEDRIRPRYLAQHVHQVWRAVNFNWPVKGYFFWSLVDNFEWDSGWDLRFGLWEVDTETQARRKRPSADLYAEICRENGLSSDMVARYAPEVLEKLFP